MSQQLNKKNNNKLIEKYCPCCLFNYLYSDSGNIKKI